MIDWTYSHFRILMRILAPNALLYTEMQTPDAIKHNPARALYFNKMENPLALQLGGSDKNKLSIATKLAFENGYVEVNLNLGCPSDKVQSGNFGACLMADPIKVAECISAMKNAANIPISAKIRIGIDENDSYEYFLNFSKVLINAGCDKLIVHARKAWLSGLSPKQNRTIPPIIYEYVYKLKKEFPKIPIIINGDIKTIPAIQSHLKYVDGVMLGRLAYKNPYAIALIHANLYPDMPILSREEVLKEYLNYIKILDRSSISLLLKPLYGLFHSEPYANFWKAQLMNIQRSDSIEKLAKLITNLRVESMTVI